MIVFDSSVALKWVFNNEEGVSQALALRNAHISGETELVVPTLFFYEIANVLAIKVQLAAAEARRAFELFADFELVVHDLDRDEYLAAMDISARYRVSVYDATYLVLAQRLKCYFITADRKFFEKVDSLGVAKLLSGEC